MDTRMQVQGSREARDIGFSGAAVTGSGELASGPLAEHSVILSSEPFPNSPSAHSISPSIRLPPGFPLLNQYSKFLTIQALSVFCPWHSAKPFILLVICKLMDVCIVSKRK